MNHMYNYHDWHAFVNTDISDFGRDDSVQIAIGAYEGGFDKWAAIEEIRPDGCLIHSYDLEPSGSPQINKLKIPLPAAKALHEALNAYFQFTTSEAATADLRKALDVERTRVDKVLDRVVPQALGSRT